VAVYLASKAGSFTTGQTIVVDGGKRNIASRSTSRKLLIPASHPSAANQGQGFQPKSAPLG
jgi:hypothetical protein